MVYGMAYRVDIIDMVCVDLIRVMHTSLLEVLFSFLQRKLISKHSANDMQHPQTRIQLHLLSFLAALCIVTTFLSHVR